MTTEPTRRAVRFDVPTEYAPLLNVLLRAFELVSEGKGAKHYARPGETIAEQATAQISKLLGDTRGYGRRHQAMKKIVEAGRLPTAAAIVGYLDAINDLALTVLALEEQVDPTKAAQRAEHDGTYFTIFPAPAEGRCPTIFEHSDTPISFCALPRDHRGRCVDNRTCCAKELELPQHVCTRPNEHPDECRDERIGGCMTPIQHENTVSTFCAYPLDHYGHHVDSGLPIIAAQNFVRHDYRGRRMSAEPDTRPHAALADLPEDDPDDDHKRPMPTCGAVFANYAGDRLICGLPPGHLPGHRV